MSAYELGYLTGQLVVYGFIVSVLVSVVILLVAKNKKKKNAKKS